MTGEKLTLGFLGANSPELKAIFRDALPQGWSLVASDGSADTPHFAEAIPEIDYLVVSATRFSAEQIARARRLRLLHKLGVGYDDIEVSGLAARGIPLAVCPVGTAEPVAEHTIALTLAALKSLVFLDNAMRQDRTWPKWQSRDRVFQLSGRVVGIVGAGRIGLRAAELFLAFGCRVLLHSRSRRPLPPVLLAYLQTGTLAWEEDLDAVFRDASIVSLHVPLDEGTRNLMNAPRMALLGPAGLLVNTSRGGLVDEAALFAALGSGKLGFAALDVTCQEPLPADNPLRGLPNVLMTPHLGGGGFDVLAAKAAFVIENCQRHAAGGAVRELVALD